MILIDETIFNHIKTNINMPDGLTVGNNSIWSFKSGSAENVDSPYIVMNKIVDPERPSTLCFSQGESGQALFQFSAYDGGSEGSITNLAKLTKDMNNFKEEVKLIRGLIGVNPNEVRIQNNMTAGVRPIGDGVNSLVTWGVIFESFLEWEIIK